MKLISIFCVFFASVLSNSTYAAPVDEGFCAIDSGYRHYCDSRAHTKGCNRYCSEDAQAVLGGMCINGSCVCFENEKQCLDRIEVYFLINTPEIVRSLAEEGLSLLGRVQASLNVG